MRSTRSPRVRRARRSQATASKSTPTLRLVTGNGVPVATSPGGSIRWSKVRTAQARIAAGYYDREEVREKVLEAVLDVLDPN